MKLINILIESIYDNIKFNDNFKSWFKNSKVIHNGKPLIVFHGTNTNFDTFKPSKTTGTHKETDQIEGIYFTDNKNGANFFALADDDNYLKPCLLSLQNPYTVKDNNTLKKELNTDKLGEVTPILKSLNYDGIIMENGFYANGGPHKLFLAFYPTQVKSIKNNGEWSLNNPNIYT